MGSRGSLLHREMPDEVEPKVLVLESVSQVLHESWLLTPVNGYQRTTQGRVE